MVSSFYCFPAVLFSPLIFQKISSKNLPMNRNNKMQTWGNGPVSFMIIPNLVIISPYKFTGLFIILPW